jgi:hypothetical protein
MSEIKLPELRFKFYLYGFLFIFSASLSACVAGDGAAKIKGNVVDENNALHKECLLELLSKQNRVLDDKAIDSKFVVTFVISPKPENYKLRIACSSSEDVFTSEPILLGDMKTYEFPVDLGDIHLKRRQ